MNLFLVEFYIGPLFVLIGTIRIQMCAFFYVALKIKAPHAVTDQLRSIWLPVRLLQQAIYYLLQLQKHVFSN